MEESLELSLSGSLEGPWRSPGDASPLPVFRRNHQKIMKGETSCFTTRSNLTSVSLGRIERSVDPINPKFEAKSFCISYRLSQDVPFPRYGPKTFDLPRIWIRPDSTREEVCQLDVVTPDAALSNAHICLKITT